MVVGGESGEVVAGGDTLCDGCGTVARSGGEVVQGGDNVLLRGHHQNRCTTLVPPQPRGVTVV